MTNPTKAARSSTGGKSYMRGSRLKQYGLQQNPNYLRRHHGTKSVNTVLPNVVSDAMWAQHNRRNAWMVQHHSAESVNNSLPQSASDALVAQQRRRTAWHMVKSVDPFLEVNKSLRVVEKLEDTLQRDSDYGHWLGKGNSHQFFDATQQDRLTNWHSYLNEVQETTRKAGLAWVRHCIRSNDWKYPSGRRFFAPSKGIHYHLLAHFMDLGEGIKGMPRNQLCSEAIPYLRVYDWLPIRGKAERLAKWEARELDIARIWMVMEMIGIGALETEKKHGFVATKREERIAMLGLAPNVVGGVISHGLHILPLPTKAAIHKPKIIEWTHVKDWAGVRDYKLPLRQNPDLSILPWKQVDYDDETDDEETETDDEQTETDDEETETDDEETETDDEETETDDEEIEPDDDLMEIDVDEMGR